MLHITGLALAPGLAAAAAATTTAMATEVAVPSQGSAAVGEDVFVPGVGRDRPHSILTRRPSDIVPAYFSRRDLRALKDLRVLHVDDQHIVTEIVAELLAPFGITPVTTTDPREALARLVGAERFDVLVTDLVMPEMTGIGLIHALLEQGRLPPTLVLSGSQGHRSQAMLRSHLDSHPGRRAHLPILYLRKNIGDFLPQLLDRLLALRRLKGVNSDAVREILPVLQEIIEQELAPSVGINPKTENLFFKVLDAFCDARFVFLLRFTSVRLNFFQPDLTV